jgi:CRISPR-associated endonuclease/helicase Cas3
MESQSIREWRALTPEEQRRIRRAQIPRKVARSMAFEGEPVTEAWVEALQQRLKAPLDTSKPRRDSYRELAPLLADRVAAVENRISLDEFADTALDENLILRLHRDIAAELVPTIGGKWRRTDVRVGNHEPPSFVRVPELMRDYALDLAARIDGMPESDYERLLETLAFAEGRLLSIHPFGDFNGRVTRVFLSELLRRLNLPAVDPTPDPGPPTARYLAALAAADRMDWGPLAMIWRERFDG